MYAGAPLSVGAFRRQVPDANRPYRMPAAWFLAPAAFVVADLLIYWSGFEVIWKLGVVLVHRVRADRHLHGVRPAAAAAGLEVGGLAAGLADRHGHHLLAGPVQRRRRTAAPANTSNIGFWWDMLIVAAFSVAIYFWAMRTKLPRDEMLLLVNKQAGEQELPPAPRH